jgi:hypothetical protein
MATPKQQKAIDLYHALMFEARNRIEAINFILSGNTRLPEGIVHELCYLQLRMLCETIALGCLVAHGDIVEAQIRNFEKEWNAEKILEKLTDLNPDFFPQQAVMTREISVISVTANTKGNALKKDELPILYGKCGGFLHRGTLKKITKFDTLKQQHMNVTDVVHWTQKIEDLLGSHLIPLHATRETAAMLFCVLRNGDHNFNTTVQRVEMQRVAAPPQ